MFQEWLATQKCTFFSTRGVSINIDKLHIDGEVYPQTTSSIPVAVLEHDGSYLLDFNSTSSVYFAQFRMHIDILFDWFATGL